MLDTLHQINGLLPETSPLLCTLTNFTEIHYKPGLLGIEHFLSMLTWKYLDLLGSTLKVD